MGAAKTGTPSPGTLRGLIAPHIDIRRGGGCFAWSYYELSKRSRASTFVILGISHVPTRRRFVLTDKDFETPFGLLPVDRDFISALSDRCGIDYYEDEFAQRNEHSVEFQAVFLKYLYGNRSDVRIVPILCSSKNETAFEEAPGEDEEFQDLHASLKQLLSEGGDRMCCIAAVDLSHMGRRFGNNLTMNATFLKQLEIEDRSMIETILKGDAEGFYRGIRDERNRRNVCGVPAIYTMLKLIDAENARLLGYEQSVDEVTQSVVSFMAAGFYG
jgi:AmmeMemoRadiSam system protein B